eukprot:gb/GECG01002708.1/.p1 GENE.gb/GECG01002708.1/~~gb/GECG01002708.1/.p1  ORF type:complete len:190 (+),score=28.59 gb/GECG01002708.1/:1-570(+)
MSHLTSPIYCVSHEPLVSVVALQASLAMYEDFAESERENLQSQLGDAKARLARYASGKGDKEGSQQANHVSFHSPQNATRSNVGGEQTGHQSYGGDMDDESLLNAVRGTAADVLHAVQTGDNQQKSGGQGNAKNQKSSSSNRDALVKGLKADMSQGNNTSRQSSARRGTTPVGRVPGGHTAQRSTSRRK